MKNFLQKIPEQVKRLSILLLVVVIVFIIATSLLTPKDFGLVGHYRAGAIQNNADKIMQYAGQETCADCHDDLWKTKNSSYHKNLSCEVCHGPSANHVNEPDQFKPEKPRDRSFCPVCHESKNKQIHMIKSQYQDLINNTVIARPIYKCSTFPECKHMVEIVNHPNKIKNS